MYSAYFYLEEIHMRKRNLLALLAALLLVVFTACTSPQANNPGSSDPTTDTTAAPTPPVYEVVEPAQKSGVYQLSEPGHLLYLAEHPDQKYALCADIDMGGYIWTPVERCI
jgi:hypothetical protein